MIHTNWLFCLIWVGQRGLARRIKFFKENRLCNSVKAFRNPNYMLIELLDSNGGYHCPPCQTILSLNNRIFLATLSELIKYQWPSLIIYQQIPFLKYILNFYIYIYYICKFYIYILNLILRILYMHTMYLIISPPLFLQLRNLRVYGLGRWLSQ